MKKITSVLLSAMSTWLIGCTANSQVENTATEELSLPVTRLVAKDTVLHHGYVTDIQAIRNVEIRARITGFLDKVYVDEGKEVKKGQLLFGINDEEYQAELARAKANLTSAVADAKAAELNVDRVRLLVDKKVISATELEVAMAKLKAANADIDAVRSSLSNASIRLSYTHIRAPFDGVIDRIPLKVGSLIDKGTLMTSVSDVQAVYAYFNVSENEYLEYVNTRRQNPTIRNNTVNLILANGSDYPYEGKIETVEGQFQESTGSIAFRARFPNPDKILKHGATGRIRLSNQLKGALMVPQKAVFEIQDRNYVFVVDSTNQVKMKNFTPKTRFSYFYVVGAGLQPGERIVCEGIQDLRDGMTIRPQIVAMDSLLAKVP